LKEVSLFWYKSRFYHISTELNGKTRVTVQSSKTALSKELEEKLQLSFFLHHFTTVMPKG